MKEREHANLYKDDWWLEHLEDELDPALNEDLKLLLKNSKPDREIFENLKSTRQLVKESDDVVLPENGHYYSDFHDRIMASLDTHSEEILPIAHKRSARMVWPAVFGTFGLTLLLSFVSWLSLRTSGVADGPIASRDEGFEIQLAALTENERGSLTEVVSGFESENDFLTDAVAQKLESLAPDEAEVLLERLAR